MKEAVREDFEMKTRQPEPIAEIARKLGMAHVIQLHPNDAMAHHWFANDVLTLSVMDLLSTAFAEFGAVWRELHRHPEQSASATSLQWHQHR